MSDETRASRLPAHGHDPVLPEQTLHYLDPKAGQVIVDCTLGRGGHGELVAQRLAPGGLLIGLDADPRNLDYARRRLERSPCRLHLAHANFAAMGDVLAEAGVTRVNGILADVGVSTNQILDWAYGLSFADTQADAPLDMRLNPDLRYSAADLLRTWDEKRIADVLYSMAQERYSRRIARKIVENRRRHPIVTVGELAELVRSVVPRERNRGRGAKAPIDPATRTFMALRMAVNRELDALSTLLANAPHQLAPDGRLVVISFHSGEDRLVKQAFRNAASLGELEVLTKKPITPDETEIARNPRARSAKLRAARKAKLA